MIHGHGDDIMQYDDIRINFSSNVYNYFSHSGLFAHLTKQLPKVYNYPDPSASKLQKVLAETLGVETENVMVSNGATEAIYLIAHANKGKKSAILQPTFSEYADACQMLDHQVSAFSSIDDIPHNAELVWLCSPNNPTGIVLDKELVIKTLSENLEKLFIIDQSYESFTLKDIVSASEGVKYPNLIILHSMTKEFAIPGLRLGYATANAKLLNEISEVRMPWSVNQMAIEAGLYLLNHREEYRLDLQSLMGEKERVGRELEATGMVEVSPSDANFMLCRLKKGIASALKDYLANEHGILIRDASNFQGLSNEWFRVAVQRFTDNEKLIFGIRKWIGAI